MNLIDEEFEKTVKPDNSKKIAKIILAFMLILIIAIIGIFFALVYMQDSTLKLYVNGVKNEKVKSMMVVEADGTVYFPIKDIAAHLGYESYNGEYLEKSEEPNKCYIQCGEEIANFALNSNKVYKLLTLDSTGTYDYFYASKPVKAINGKLYATIDAIEQAFNISFGYDTENKISIYTMPYLIEAYSTRVLDYGYEAISDVFTNKKTVLNDMLVVTKNEDKNYAVIDVMGNIIIEPKYDYIEYLPHSGDFLVKSNNKTGIISAKKETKIQLLYDNLKLIDKDSGLYLAQRDNKYGVIDSRGNIKIYIEYDQIGIDSSLFEKNDIKNKYLLINGMIPARKEKMWGAFDKNGKEVLKFEYDSFGYVATSNKDAMNLLMIPDYNVMVACKSKKYTLVNSVGTELCFPVLDDVYMTINSGQKYYYMNYAGNLGVSVIEFLDTIGAKPVSNSSETNNQQKENETQEQEPAENEVQENEQEQTQETQPEGQDSEQEQPQEGQQEEQTEFTDVEENPDE